MHPRDAPVTLAAVTLVRTRVRAKNDVHPLLMRCSKDRPPASDLFGVKDRAWLAEQHVALTERETVGSAVREVEFLDTEIAEVDDARSVPAGPRPWALATRRPGS